LRVTYIGYDYFSPVLLYLLTRRDVTINRVVTERELGEHVCQIAGAADIPLLLTRVRMLDMRIFAADSDLVLCASYGYRLPIPTNTACQFLNVHPSLLPLGRGPVSPLWTLTRFPETAGVTLHVMDDGFDSGAIVAQVAMAAHAESNLEVYTHHANQAAIGLLHQIDLERLTRLDLHPQDEGLATYQPEFGLPDRIVTSLNTGAEIAKLVGALGALGVVVDIAGIRYVATQVRIVSGKPDFPMQAFVNDFYGFFPCADATCLFPKASLLRVAG
jgi:methionyl-tRNA formyltransferase